MRPGSTTGRGYGSAHQRIRARLLPTAYGQPCCRCGQEMKPGQRLDLDHTDDRTGYLGFSHAACNRSAGANSKSRKPKPDPPPNPPRTKW